MGDAAVLPLLELAGTDNEDEQLGVDRSVCEEAWLVNTVSSGFTIRWQLLCTSPNAKGSFDCCKFARRLSVDFKVSSFLLGPFQFD